MTESVSSRHRFASRNECPNAHAWAPRENVSVPLIQAGSGQAAGEHCTRPQDRGLSCSEHGTVSEHGTGFCIGGWRLALEPTAPGWPCRCARSGQTSASTGLAGAAMHANGWIRLTAENFQCLPVAFPARAIPRRVAECAQGSGREGAHPDAPSRPHGLLPTVQRLRLGVGYPPAGNSKHVFFFSHSLALGRWASGSITICRRPAARRSRVR
jgi:hypothetical protein